MNIDQSIKNAKTTLINDQEAVHKFFTCFSNIKNKEVDIHTAYENLSKSLQEIKQKEPAVGINNMWEQLSKQISEMNKARKNLINTYEKKLMESLNIMLTNVKDKKKQSDALDKLFQTHQKNELKLNTSKEDPKITEDKKRKNEIDFKKVDEEFQQKKTQFDNTMKIYLKERNKEYKFLISHYINCEMQMSVQSIQRLTQLAGDLQKVDEIKESEFLISRLLGKNLMVSNQPNINPNPNPNPNPELKKN